jgi:N-acetyl sugar amidotransferase
MTNGEMPKQTNTQNEEGKLEAYYGLPEEVKYCKKCVYSNQNPISDNEFAHDINRKKRTLNLNDDGVCDACSWSDMKKGGTVDWKQREQELIDLCNKHRKDDGSYDCLVPGSGGKDSFYASHILKFKYGMHPLTVTWAPHMYTDWGWKNFQAWIHAGFDNYLFTPNGRIHRLLTRLATENIFYPFQPFVIGQKNFAPKFALKHKISLIFFGENEAEYGNPVEDNFNPNRDWSYATADDPENVFISGVAVHALKKDYGLTQNDLLPYLPSRLEDMEEMKIQFQFLGYYLPWHPQGCYYYAVEHSDFRCAPERTPGTYSKYNSIDDKIDDFHFLSHYIKFGMGRATYDAAQEIRNEEITRDEGIALVKKFDGEFPERFAEEIFRYLSIPEKEYPVASRMFESPLIDRDYFMSLCDRFRSPHLWKKENGQWKLRHPIWEIEGK